MTIPLNYLEIVPIFTQYPEEEFTQQMLYNANQASMLIYLDSDALESMINQNDGEDYDRNKYIDNLVLYTDGYAIKSASSWSAANQQTSDISGACISAPSYGMSCWFVELTGNVDGEWIYEQSSYHLAIALGTLEPYNGQSFDNLLANGMFKVENEHPGFHGNWMCDVSIIKSSFLNNEAICFRFQPSITNSMKADFRFDSETINGRLWVYSRYSGLQGTQPNDWNSAVSLGGLFSTVGLVGLLFFSITF